MRQIIFWISIFLLALTQISCDDSPVFPIKPQIEFLDIQPKEVKALDLNQPITVTFRFQDGDGNLGVLDSNENNLQLIDSRVSLGLSQEKATNYFSIPNLTPDARNPSIQGEITVQIPFTVIVEPGVQEEKVRYQIKLWDRMATSRLPLMKTRIIPSIQTGLLSFVKFIFYFLVLA